MHDAIPDRYIKYSDKISAQFNKINKYIITYLNKDEPLRIKEVIEIINNFANENNIIDFKKACQQFGYKLSTLIIKNDKEDIIKLLRLGGKKCQTKMKKTKNLKT